MVSPQTVAEFLEARIAEDEARASSGWARLGDSRWETDNYGRDFLTPSAVLAECAAKRAIAGFYGELEKGAAPGMRMAVYQTVKCLAAVYADHPDYDKDWAP